jgi:hypothetical protein
MYFVSGQYKRCHDGISGIGQTPSITGSRLRKIKLVERLFLEKRILLGQPAFTGPPRKFFPQDSFHHAQCVRHSEITISVIEVGLISARAGINLGIVHMLAL